MNGFSRPEREQHGTWLTGVASPDVNRDRPEDGRSFSVQSPRRLDEFRTCRPT